MGFAENLLRQVRADYTSLRKAAGTAGAPSNAMITAASAFGMDTTTPLGPGEPIRPSMGYGLTPRSQDYQSGRNINGRPRSMERISFGTLRSVIRAYDVAQICISHRIDSLRGVDWNIVGMDGYEGDGDDIAVAVRVAKKILEKPDGNLPFHSWLHKYLYDVLAFDAGTLYKMRNRAGRATGLEVVDGTTIAPLLDKWGRTPGFDPDAGVWAPAYVQYVQGTAANWLTADDLIYTPFRPLSDSPYGLPAMETVLQNANTDLRFQLFFLQQFTDGNIPAMFAQAPETWTPQQLADFQATWDALMTGDEAVKAQVKWVPGGGSFTQVNQNSVFNNDMSMWLMRKTASAFHVTPSDLGFTEDTNRATGDSQADVSARTGDLPLMKHVDGILTRFLQDDVGLPVEFHFESGAEEDDVLQTAQADEIYIKTGVVSVSEIAERRFGVVDEERLPRFVYSNTAGFLPLADLVAASSRVDESGAPEIADVQPARQLAIEAIPNAAPAPEVGKPETVAKNEVAQFRKYVDGRRKRGKWRDFTFQVVDPTLAKSLNREARALVEGDAFSRANATVIKDEAPSTVTVAGLAVWAADTGRTLMLQRGLDPADPAQGTWEFPGGHLEGAEEPFDAACREWQEETGCALPAGAAAGSWVSGIYQGFVWLIETEAAVAVRNPAEFVNPDGDLAEAIAWWRPSDLDGLPALRPELASVLPTVLPLLGIQGTPVLVKSARDMAPKTPQHLYDLRITDYYAPQIAAALEDLIPGGLDAMVERAATLVTKADDTDPQAAAAAQIRRMIGDPALSDDLKKLLDRIDADGYTAGGHAASQQVTDAGVTPVASSTIDWDTWEPGDTDAALQAADGGLARLLANQGITIRDLQSNTLDMVGNRIASGVANGDGSTQIGRDLRSLLGSRSEIIAHTETTRAVTAGSMSTYRDSGIDEWDLVISDDACEECVAIEEDNPHPVDDDEDQPPVHPWCRCSSSPRASSYNGGGDDSSDNSDSGDESAV